MYSKLLEVAIAALLILGAWWYSGHTAVQNYIQAQAVKQGEVDKIQQKKYDTLAASYETLRDKRESDAKIIVKQVEKVVAGDVVYRNVCFSDSGLQLANESIAGASSAKLDDSVPTAE